MVNARLAQCLRCKAYTLLDTSGPVALAVDIAPLDVNAYRDALLGGVGRYRVQKRQNGATKLLAAPLGAPVSFDPASGAQIATDGFVHGEHEHEAMHQRPVAVVVPGKASAPATPGAPPAGSRPLAAHVYAARGPATRSPATTATHHLSNAYPVCGTCRRNIKAGEIYVGVQHGPLWIWAEHEECK